jgi:hypothetical protein
VDAAKGLEDEKTSILNELFQAGHQEEIVHQHNLTLPQLLLGTVKVKVDVQAHDKLGHWVLVRVRLL